MPDLTPYFTDGGISLYGGHCLDVLRKQPDASFDSVVTDPPYGLSNTTSKQVIDALGHWLTGEREYVPGGAGFMGQDWDAFVPPPAVWDECLRVLKPGGYLVAFAGSRTADLMTLSLRLGGFDIRDGLAWVTGSGMPKSLNVSKAVEAEQILGASNTRALRAIEQSGDGETYTLHGRNNGIMGEDRVWERKVFTPRTPEAQRWVGWGTALRPAQEPIVLARKPLDGTVARNVLTHGVGALNVAAATATGRWPANLVFSHLSDNDGCDGCADGCQPGCGVLELVGQNPDAADYFPVFRYQAKASKKERPVLIDADGKRVAHSTVKPLALMQWLTRLVTPPRGRLLEPFAGSGTTVEACLIEGFDCVAIEQGQQYLPMTVQRIERHRFDHPRASCASSTPESEVG